MHQYGQSWSVSENVHYHMVNLDQRLHTCFFYFNTAQTLICSKASEYDQEMPKPQTVNQHGLEDS